MWSVFTFFRKRQLQSAVRRNVEQNNLECDDRRGIASKCNQRAHLGGEHHTWKWHSDRTWRQRKCARRHNGQNVSNRHARWLRIISGEIRNCDDVRNDCVDSCVDHCRYDDGLLHLLQTMQTEGKIQTASQGEHANARIERICSQRNLDSSMNLKQGSHMSWKSWNFETDPWNHRISFSRSFFSILEFYSPSCTCCPQCNNWPGEF